MDRAKEYQKKRQTLTLFQLILMPLLLWLSLATPLSLTFEGWAVSITSNPYLVVILYFVLLSLYLFVFDFPFAVYSGFLLEHEYQLSNQTYAAWLKDYAKKSVLSFVFSLALIEGLFALIWNFPEAWWLIAWATFSVVSYGLGKIFPVVIVPLFYKYGKIEREELRKKILAMAAQYKMPLENVYTLNLSKTTKKANAAFMGMGKTKRVVLSDTLLDNFTDDEIEVVVAHELGHFIHRDIWRQLAFGLVTSLATFWIAFLLIDPLSAMFGLQGAQDIAALPLLFMIFFFVGLVLMPLQHGFSRMLERAADRFALETGPPASVFVSCMDKLGKVNLADPSPSPLYEWFFYDHPAIAKRIRFAETFQKLKGNVA